MKVAFKVGVTVSLIFAISISMLLLNQYLSMRASIKANVDDSMTEVGEGLAHQIANWMNGKKAIINYTAEIISTNPSTDHIQQLFNRPILKQEFITVFGGLESDGVAIHNDPSWDSSGWDARKRPWYDIAKNANTAVLTAPYTDANTNDIIISVVANIYDNHQFIGAFGGDLSLKAVSDAINTVDLGGAGYAFILNKQGQIITHPEGKFNDKHMSALFGSEVPKLSSSIELFHLNENPVYVTFTPLSGLNSVDWYVGIVVDKNLVMNEADSLGWRALFVGLIAVFICAVLLRSLMTKFLSPLHHLNESLSDINSGDGDLTKRLPVESDDEFADVATEFNRFVAKLQTMIRDIKLLNLDILKESTLSSDESEESSHKMEQQLDELDKLASAMLEMTTSANEVANFAKQAALVTEQADNEAKTGVQTVSHSTEMIADLAKDMDQAVASVTDVATYSANIETILQVIAGIAEQTNLLALNAAIEAARAGETGRGFAVVADEVRSLASRTQDSTNEIRQMIEQLQTGVRHAEDKIMQSRDKANATVNEANEANQTLQNIRQRIGELSTMAHEIASASAQQSATSNEINRNTGNIRDICQSVVEVALHLSEHSHSATSQVKKQNKHLDQFKV